MGSHSVTCHPTQVITPAKQAGTRFTYPGGMEGWVDLGSLIADRPGIGRIFLGISDVFYVEPLEAAETEQTVAETDT